MRPEIKALLRFGSIAQAQDDDVLEQLEHAITQIVPPLQDAEASVLIPLFGKDPCDDGGGLAWPLVHLIETSPTAYPAVRPLETDGYWINLLYQRKKNAGL
jgi:hypothetical protein